MPRTTVAMRSRRSPVRGFFFRRTLAAISIAAGVGLVGLAGYHWLDGMLAQASAREAEPVDASEAPAPEAAAPPEVIVEGPEAEVAPLVQMDALDESHFDGPDTSEAISEAEAGGIPLVDTADLTNLAAPRLDVPVPPAPDNPTSLRIAIPRLGLDLAVVEGVSAKALRRGPGHLPGTPCFGLANGEGNCVLTGHRDSFFRPLADARKGDVVELRVGNRSRRYRLVRKMIVRPEQTDVVAPTADARLTLLTCYPFRWIGAAPWRLVWQAEPEVTTLAGTR